MPEGVSYSIVYDTTKFVRASIKSVVVTLLEALALVVLVVIVFLQTWRASIIPLVAVPVSIVGTFALMLAFGFSINALSLFGLVLAIGIVVDDAIVVVENVERNIAAGLSPRDATVQAMQEVSGPIVAIALVLVAVFVPMAFVSGLTGEFYRQFALTIAISTVISAFNSLTLSPALAAMLLKGHGEPKDKLTRGMDFAFGWFFRAFNRAFQRSGDAYGASVGRVLGRKAIVFAVYGALVALTWAGFQSVPRGFIPAQDKQYLVAMAQLPDGAALDRTEAVIKQMSAIAMKQPGVEAAVAFPGLSINGFTNSSNAGIVFITLDSVRPAPLAGAVELCDRAGAQRPADVDPGRLRRGLPAAAGAGPGHDRRLQAAARGPRRARLRSAVRGAPGLPEEGLCDAGAGRPVLELPDQRAAAARRRRPRQGQAARRGRDRRLRHHADLPRLALRQRLQPLRPHLPGQGPGRRALPRECRRRAASSRPATRAARWCRCRRCCT